MARDGDAENESGDPDECRISKKQVRKIGASLAGLAEMFVRASNLIENSIRSIASQLSNIKVGSGKGKGGGGKADKGPVDNSGQEKLARKIASGAFKKLEQAKQKTIEEEISAYYESEKSQIKAQEEASAIAIESQLEVAKREAIQAKIDGLQIEKYRKAVIEQRKRQLEQEELETEKQLKDLEEFSKKEAANLEKFRKEEEAAAKAKTDAANQEAIQARILELQVKSWSKALSEQKKRQAEREAQEAEKRSAQEKLVRDAEAKARADFFSNQEKEILKQAPIAYGLGKAFGFLTASILKIGSGAAKGLFASKEMSPEDSSNLEKQYLRYEGAPKREERARRKAQTPIDPLVAKEDEYNARKGVSKPPRRFAKGGQAKGTDTVSAMLTPGEYVVNRDATKKNRGILESINNGTQYYAAGGLVALAGRGIAAAGRGAAAAGRGAAAGAEMAGMPRLANVINGITTAMGPIGPAFQAINYAVLGGVDAFNKLTNFAGTFVSAVNPALMQQLGLAFKDLQAVIGVGLQPIIAAAIPIVRAFADSLQPVMQALLPTFDKFAQSMISLSGPIISLVVEAFAALEPVMAVVTAAVEAWAAILTSLAPVISTVFKEVIYRITQVATTFQWLVGKLLSWIPGTGDAGKKLMESADSAQKTADLYYQGQSEVQKAVKGPIKKGASVGSAAQTASFKGISEFGKGLMQAAFSSSTQAAALKTAEYSEKTYNELAKMNARMGGANPAAPAAGVRRAGP